MVDTRSLPHGGSAWHSHRGELGVWLPAPNLLLVGLSGHGEAAFVTPILDAYASLPKTGSIHAFFDADALTSYDTPLRTELTARFVPDRKRFASFHVLVQSRIVAMGVSVANLTLGGIVRATADRAQFKTGLDACLFQRRVIGFSSNVLDGFARRTRSAMAD